MTASHQNLLYFDAAELLASIDLEQNPFRAQRDPSFSTVQNLLFRWSTKQVDSESTGL
jgi:hypothetical protein